MCFKKVHSASNLTILDSPLAISNKNSDVYELMWEFQRRLSTEYTYTNT